MHRRSLAIIAAAFVVMFAASEIAQAQVGLACMAARRVKKRMDEKQKEQQAENASAQEPIRTAEGTEAGSAATETAEAQPSQQ